MLQIYNYSKTIHVKIPSPTEEEENICNELQSSEGLTKSQSETQLPVYSKIINDETRKNFG